MAVVLGVIVTALVVLITSAVYSITEVYKVIERGEESDVHSLWKNTK